MLESSLLLLLETYHCVSVSLITAKNAYTSTVKTKLLEQSLLFVVVEIVSLRFCQPCNR